MSQYAGREQTRAKHFILRGYLQALAYKVLHWSDITYVDGFSGPWKSKDEKFADTSFMIALTVLKDAQEKIFQQTGIRRKVRCFFSETDTEAFAQLDPAVAPYHDPANGFEVRTYCGKFEDAVPDIQAFVGSSFPLMFIDPTGWTGYPLPKIKPLFARPKCEVLVNFMYDHVNRFSASEDEKIVASFDPILGGPGWHDRLDISMPHGPAVEKLFRETLKAECGLEYVVSTTIAKTMSDRTHFILAYGTKDRAGLKAFRQIEYDALRHHAKNRASAKETVRETKTGIADMFAQEHIELQEQNIDAVVAHHKAQAKQRLMGLLSDRGKQRFSDVVVFLLEEFMLRETNVKDICVELAQETKIKNTWGTGNNKPKDESAIELE